MSRPSKETLPKLARRLKDVIRAEFPEVTYYELTLNETRYDRSANIALTDRTTNVRRVWAEGSNG